MAGSFLHSFQAQSCRKEANLKLTTKFWKTEKIRFNQGKRGREVSLSAVSQMLSAQRRRVQVGCSEKKKRVGANIGPELQPALAFHEDGRQV